MLILEVLQVNNGVYRSGFATSAKAYETAVVKLFESLDKLEKILEGKEFVVGDQLTEADVRLYTTIVSAHCLTFTTTRTDDLLFMLLVHSGSFRSVSYFFLSLLETALNLIHLRPLATTVYTNSTSNVISPVSD